MNDLLVDTSGWGHLVDPTQAYHALAAKLYRDARQKNRKLLTTNYIITELVALMSSPLRLPRSSIIAFIEGMKVSQYIEIIHITASIDERAWQLLKQREDKDWSLVDCASFVLMGQCGINEALTTDHHFEQAGFIRMLK